MATASLEGKECSSPPHRNETGNSAAEVLCQQLSADESDGIKNPPLLTIKIKQVRAITVTAVCFSLFFLWKINL